MRSTKGNLSVMDRQIFADTGVMGLIFKCQPATYHCWNTSCCLSPVQVLHWNSRLLSFCSLVVHSFSDVPPSIMGGSLSALKPGRKKRNLRLLHSTDAAFLQLQWLCAPNTNASMRIFNRFLNNQRWNICIQNGNVITDATRKTNRLQNQSCGFEENRPQTCARNGDGASLFVCGAKQAGSAHWLWQHCEPH